MFKPIKSKLEAQGSMEPGECLGNVAHNLGETR